MAILALSGVASFCINIDLTMSPFIVLGFLPDICKVGIVLGVNSEFE
jgi:hypothetical protein